MESKFIVQRKHMWWVGWSLALCLLACGAYLFAFAEIGSDVCRPTIRAELPSPDQAKSVLTYEMECGATVGFNTQLSVSSNPRQFSPRREPSFLYLAGNHEVHVSWKGVTAIEVELPSSAKVFRQEKTVGNISIIYK